ncbi:mycothiol conjugate amidase Mca [Falsarthrobacter nasiphocae]|uniref:Mycothiol S-conjugate amidase n=1 Tax=Falsarthrobacter nasiphocae TaxID=189863 RepID=A0AAE3YFB1_9MICC|nr:mycothiol conjugate amidase Mca [Falsarthrobacter nasiphocae]MDR6891647.1 mycothiol S-conjugate amidase [Falsarthrobacter nasiphocae]
MTTASTAPAEGFRILAVHAHPDDESSKGAGTMLRYLSEGARVMVATMTGGERGSVLNANVAAEPMAARDLAGMRIMEMAEAARHLGVEHRWIGFADSGLPEGDPLPPLPAGCFGALPLEQASAPLIRLVRSFRPHVILAYDENGGYPHPDHIMSHRVAMEAYQRAGDPDAYPGLGEPWAPSKLYYDRGFSPERFTTYHETLLKETGESPFTEWLSMLDQPKPESWITYETTTRIDVGPFIEKREDALKAHRTQIDPESTFFALSAEKQREVWPWEDYILADSRVETSLPETDLLAGLR